MPNIFPYVEHWYSNESSPREPCFSSPDGATFSNRLAVASRIAWPGRKSVAPGSAADLQEVLRLFLERIKATFSTLRPTAVGKDVVEKAGLIISCRSVGTLCPSLTSEYRAARATR